MAYTIRKGTMADVPAVAAVYDALLQYEGEHGTATGWQAGVYPTAAVAEGAAVQGTLFVLEEDGAVGAAMILNQVQAPGCRRRSTPQPHGCTTRCQNRY